LVEEDKISSIALAMRFFVGDLCLKAEPKGMCCTWIDIGEKNVSFGIIWYLDRTKLSCCDDL